MKGQKGEVEDNRVCKPGNSQRTFRKWNEKIMMLISKTKRSKKNSKKNLMP